MAGVVEMTEAAKAAMGVMAATGKEGVALVIMGVEAEETAAA